MEKLFKEVVGEGGTKTYEEVPVFKAFTTEDEFKRFEQSTLSTGKGSLLKELGVSSLQEVKDKITASGEDKLKPFLEKLGIEDESKIDDFVSELEKLKEVEQTNAQLLAEKKTNEQLSKLKDLGISDKFAKYVLNEIGEVENFDEAVSEYAKNNPQFTAEVYQKIDASADLSGGTRKRLEDITDTEEYIREREKQLKEQ